MGVTLGSKEQSKPDHLVLMDLAKENDLGLSQEVIRSVIEHMDLSTSAVSSVYLGIAFFGNAVKSNQSEVMCAFGKGILKGLFLHVPRITESATSVDWGKEISTLVKCSKNSRAYSNKLLFLLKRQIEWSALAK